MIFIFALFTLTARAGEVLKFEAKSACANRLTGPRLTRLDPITAHETHQALLERIRATDPAGVLMRVDFTGRIWDWTPLAEDVFLDVTFARDARGVAFLAMVSRGRDERDLIIETPAKIREIEAALKTQLEDASVMIDGDLDTLNQRPRLSDGLVF